jgi:hypothetical protein
LKVRKGSGLGKRCGGCPSEEGAWWPHLSWRAAPGELGEGTAAASPAWPCLESALMLAALRCTPSPPLFMRLSSRGPGDGDALFWENEVLLGTKGRVRSDWRLGRVNRRGSKWGTKAPTHALCYEWE